MAAASNNATCIASQPDANQMIANDSPCDGAIDGKEYSSSGRWTFTGDAVGTWLNITFAQTYNIAAVKIMPLRTENKIENMSLSFDDHSKVNVSPSTIE